ncbi:MAG: XrtA system polysaccharide deacetylase [Phycisphaerae bacterium]
MFNKVAQEQVQHCLSFDVEEYFQVEAAARHVRRDQWADFAMRLAPHVDRVLELLDSHRAGATFFVLGWVARHEPELVKRIAEAGHEIASHGMHHQMLHKLTPRALRLELNDSRKLLEDLTGRPVSGFRAPTFSLTLQTAWAIDVLTECGYRYDSSVYPVRHDRYGVPDAPRRLHRARGPAGGELVEIPLLTRRWCGLNVPAGGGGYLRLFPLRVITGALNSCRRTGEGGMLYLHPWELDRDQPVLPMGRLTRWRHRVGLARTERKLSRLLERYRFRGASALLDQTRLERLPVHHYRESNGIIRPEVSPLHSQQRAR